VVTVVACAAFITFGLVWLSSQQWMDWLPRRWTRGLATVSAVVLASLALMVPDGFQLGIQRYATYIERQTQAKLQALLDALTQTYRQPVTDTGPAPRRS